MKRNLIGMVVLVFLLAACAAPTPSPTSNLPTATGVPPTAVSPTRTPLPSTTLIFTPVSQPQSVKFAVIGDYGEDNSAEADVAALIQGWQPDFIITVGDNNYPSGAANTIDANVGKYYHDYIYPYSGTYGPGAEVNRFFPTLGNHDWYSRDAQPYLDYFTLPGNERYYDFVSGPVHFFALDSDENEPDGVTKSSAQAAWLQQGLSASVSAWNIVYFHHPPYSSGDHGSTIWLRWPFTAWGTDAVFSGHDHTYERLLVDDIPYFVDGAGGDGLYNFDDPLPESQFRYNANYGAMLVTSSGTEILFAFYNRVGDLIDSYQVTKP